MGTISRGEWLFTGRTLFGKDPMKWRFVCPSCGNIQAVEDYREYKEKGATPESARFNCIGRYDGKHGDVPMLSGKSPCNYTTGGLFNITPVKVIDGESESYSFAFDKGAKK